MTSDPADDATRRHPEYADAIRKMDPRFLAVLNDFAQISRRAIEHGALLKLDIRAGLEDAQTVEGQFDGTKLARFCRGQAELFRENATIHHDLASGYDRLAEYWEQVAPDAGGG